MGHQNNEIISSLFWTYFCGDDSNEDIGTHLGYQLELRTGTTISSPDTLRRGIKEFKEENIFYMEASGTDYSSNIYGLHAAKHYMSECLKLKIGMRLKSTLRNMK